MQIRQELKKSMRKAERNERAEVHIAHPGSSYWYLMGERELKCWVRLGIRKKFFDLRTVKKWTKLLREIQLSPYLEILKP